MIWHFNIFSWILPALLDLLEILVPHFWAVIGSEARRCCFCVAAQMMWFGLPPLRLIWPPWYFVGSYEKYIFFECLLALCHHVLLFSSPTLILQFWLSIVLTLLPLLQYQYENRINKYLHIFILSFFEPNWNWKKKLVRSRFFK